MKKKLTVRKRKIIKNLNNSSKTSSEDSDFETNLINSEITPQVEISSQVEILSNYPNNYLNFNFLCVFQYFSKFSTFALFIFLCGQSTFLCAEASDLFKIIYHHDKIRFFK